MTFVLVVETPRTPTIYLCDTRKEVAGILGEYPGFPYRVHTVDHLMDEIWLQRLDGAHMAAVEADRFREADTYIRDALAIIKRHPTIPHHIIAA